MHISGTIFSLTLVTGDELPYPKKSLFWNTDRQCKCEQMVELYFKKNNRKAVWTAGRWSIIVSLCEDQNLHKLYVFFLGLTIQQTWKKDSSLSVVYFSFSVCFRLAQTDYVWHERSFRCPQTFVMICRLINNMGIKWVVASSKKIHVSNVKTACTAALRFQRLLIWAHSFYDIYSQV